MKLYNLTIAAGALLTLFSAAGCSGSDDWKPGPEDTEKGVSAYFPVPAKTSYIFDSEADPEDMKIEVNVSRQNIADAIAVPLSLSSGAEGCGIPSAVNFEAGEAEASFILDCAGIPDGKMQEVTISLDPSQTDIYGIGLDAVTFSVIKAEWTLISDNLRYSLQYGNYPDVFSNMYHLQGTTQLKLENFFGSGLDIIFDCPSQYITPFIPTVNALVEDEALLEWELYDEANQTYPEWNPGNDSANPYITYLYAYGADDGYDWTYGDMYYNASTGYGYFYMCFYLETDDGNWGYAYPYLDFNLKYNPFE